MSGGGMASPTSVTGDAGATSSGGAPNSYQRESDLKFLRDLIQDEKNKRENSL
jgi:hypothetical protein